MYSIGYNVPLLICSFIATLELTRNGEVKEITSVEDYKEYINRTNELKEFEKQERNKSQIFCKRTKIFTVFLIICLIIFG